MKHKREANSPGKAGAPAYLANICRGEGKITPSGMKVIVCGGTDYDGIACDESSYVLIYDSGRVTLSDFCMTFCWKHGLISLCATNLRLLT